MKLTVPGSASLWTLILLFLNGATLANIQSDIRLETWNFADFLIDIFNRPKLFRYCTLQLFFNPDYLYSGKIGNEFSLTEAIGDLVAHPDLLVQTNGVTISKIGNSTSGYQKPKKIFHSRRCSVVVVIMTSYSTQLDEHIKRALTYPTLRPPTIPNRDKYLIVFDQQNLENIESSNFFTSLKYKLFLTVNYANRVEVNKSARGNEYLTNLQVAIQKPCPHKKCKSEIISLQAFEKSDELKFLFPDQETNLLGRNFRVSASEKVPELLELQLIRDETTGAKAYKPVRGVYATVFLELVQRLNLSYEVILSSGNGSTGKILKKDAS